MLPTQEMFDTLFNAGDNPFPEYIFDSPAVSKIYERVHTLKSEYHNTETLTKQINKREALLGMEKTIFTELKVVQDELRPLHDLWNVAN